ASAILNHSGIRVQIARNGLQCLQLLDTVQPTCIVTDLSMPEMDGWEMLAELRANPQTKHIPVIAVTAYYSADLAHDALKAGFDAYFPKPISPRTFVENLENILR